MNADQSIEPPYGFIQYKGTDVCMDVYCTCGNHGHFDGDFFYFWECSKCGRKYEVGCYVKMFEMTKDQLDKKRDENCTVDFKMDT